MSIQDIKERLRGRFTAFSLRTSDGEKFPVPHPEFIYLTERRVVVSTKDGYVNVLDPLHIVSIENVEVLPS